VSPARKREAARHLQEKFDASERRACEVVDQPRSTQRYTGHPQDDDHVFVIWLPRYSPELNLIEGLWGYLKRSALNNYFYGNIGSLERAIHQAFRNLQRSPHTTLALNYRTATNLRKTA